MSASLPPGCSQRDCGEDDDARIGDTSSDEYMSEVRDRLDEVSGGGVERHAEADEIERSHPRAVVKSGITPGWKPGIGGSNPPCSGSRDKIRPSSYLATAADICHQPHYDGAALEIEAREPGGEDGIEEARR